MAIKPFSLTAFLDRSRSDSALAASGSIAAKFRTALKRVLGFCSLLTVSTLTAQALVEPPVAPADEKLPQPDMISATAAAMPPGLIGHWGKCLKGADTRCYFISIGNSGDVSTRTYVSQRAKQFDEDPGTGSAHCYDSSNRTLARLGEYTYAWQDEIDSSNSSAPPNLLKIVVDTSTVRIFKGDVLQLQLPALSDTDWRAMKVCGQ